MMWRFLGTVVYERRKILHAIRRELRILINVGLVLCYIWLVLTLTLVDR